MNRIDPSLSYHIQSRGIDGDVWYIVVDTYLFSTTVTAALDNNISRVYCAKDEDGLDRFASQDNILSGGEKFYERDDQAVGNSPIVFRDNNFEVDGVALTSDNGAKKS